MYLFVLKQQARRGTASQGGALLLPTGAELQRRSCSPAGCGAVLQPRGWALSGQGHGQGQRSGKRQIRVSPKATQEFFHKHRQLPARCHPSRKTSLEHQPEGSPAGFAGYLWVSTAAPGGGRGDSHPHQAASLSRAILPSAAAPPDSRHTRRAPQLRGARSDRHLIFVPLFQQAWKQDTQERHCQQHCPPPSAVSRRAPHTTSSSSICGSRLTPEPESKECPSPKKNPMQPAISRAPYQAGKEATLTSESKATGPGT